MRMRPPADQRRKWYYKYDHTCWVFRGARYIQQIFHSYIINSMTIALNKDRSTQTFAWIYNTTTFCCWHGKSYDVHGRQIMKWNNRSRPAGDLEPLLVHMSGEYMMSTVDSMQEGQCIWYLWCSCTMNINCIATCTDFIKVFSIRPGSEIWTGDNTEGQTCACQSIQRENVSSSLIAGTTGNQHDGTSVNSCAYLLFLCQRKMSLEKKGSKLNFMSVVGQRRIRYRWWFFPFHKTMLTSHEKIF